MTTTHINLSSLKDETRLILTKAMGDKEIQIRGKLHKIEKRLIKALEDYGHKVQCIADDRKIILDELTDYLRDKGGK